MEKCLCPGKFLHFHIIEKVNSKGMDVKWEFVCRPHQTESEWLLSEKKQSLRQGVDIIPVFKQHLILNIEKRYPVQGYVLSFPGGICDTEDVRENAIRELQEETGYNAPRETSEVSPMTYTDAWKSTEKSQYVTLFIDEGESNHKEQELEDLEEIRPILVSKNSLIHEIHRLSSEQNLKIDSRLYAYSLGIMAKYN